MRLQSKMEQQRLRALASGDLQPTETEQLELVEGKVRFSVRVLRGHDRKKHGRRDQKQSGVDPFMPPYEDELFVAELSHTHVALLNKFPVLENHLLIVTCEFEEQQSGLSLSDFAALTQCMEPLGGLGFYNGGHAAGASQSHKHLQLVPLKLTTAALLDGASGFRCAELHFDRELNDQRMYEGYLRLLDRLRLDPNADPYNLLVTSECMVVVPRSRHAWEGIAVNALGFAGYFLVKNDAKLARLRDVGATRVLCEVAYADQSR